MDNPFDTPTSGQADWDSSLSANFTALERGYHVTERAGTIINTGEVLWLDNAGFFHQFNPTSGAAFPVAMAFTAAASGDTLTALAWGIVRSLDINSGILPGQRAFVSTLTPGLIVGSDATMDCPIGMGLMGNGILFNPSKVKGPGRVTNSLAISAVVASLHTFTLPAAGFGWNRYVRVNGAAATNVEVKLYADVALSSLQYQTLSGGISAVGSFYDRAGFPFDTVDGNLYGTLTTNSPDTINIQAQWEF